MCNLGQAVYENVSNIYNWVKKYLEVHKMVHQIYYN